MKKNEKLKRARKSRGVTQAKLAEIMQVEQPYIAAWENGKRNPSAENLRKLAEYLEVDLSWLSMDDDPSSDRIPIYDLHAAAGIKALYQSANTNPIDYLVIPGLGKVDGAIPASGDSMLPLVKSGDYVVYKFPTNLDNGINWGKMYVVGIKLDGEDLVTLKYIYKSKKGNDYVCLVSENKEYSDVDVHLNDLQGYAIVKAYVSKTVLI